jgi:hypothetical protein
MQAVSRYAVIAFLVALASPAAANKIDRGFSFDAPRGLAYNAELSKQLADALAGKSHYDGAKTELGVDAYVAEDGWALYVTWIFATETIDAPALKVRRAFDAIRQSPVDPTAKVQSTEMVSWRENVTDELATGELEWRHISNETVTMVKSSMWLRPPGWLRQVRAECVMPAPRADELRARCGDAFARLKIHDQRTPLGAIPSAGELRVRPPGDDGDMLLVVEGGVDAGAERAQPSMRAPTEGGVMYRQPETSGSEGGRDNTILYLGGAILLVVAIYMAMRGRGDAAPQEDDDSE